MHQLGILDEVRERVILRRGGVAVFDRLSPRRTAHGGADGASHATRLTLFGGNDLSL